jgi:hypothetical protein
MIPEAIRRRLSRLRWRERELQLSWGVTRALALTVLFLALACLIDWPVDRRRETPWGLRQAMLAGQIVVWAGAVWLFVLRPLSRSLSDKVLALWIEQKLPGLAHRLISAVQLNRPGAAISGMSPDLIALVSREAEQETSHDDFARLADHRRFTWSVCLLAVLVIAAAVPLVCWPATVSALLARQFLNDREIPRSIQLESVHRELVWPAGEDVLLRFRVRGDAVHAEMQGEVRIAPEGEPTERYPLSVESILDQEDAIFTARVPASSTDFTYEAWLVDGRTRAPSHVHFEARPAVVEQRTWVQLPAYCGLRPDGTAYEVEQNRGDIIAIAGSSARIAVKIQKPITAAILELLGSPAPSGSSTEVVLRRLPLQQSSNALMAEGTFALRPNESSYQVIVQDENGFQNANPPRRSIRIVPEELPRVALLPEQFPGSDDQTPGEESEVEGVPVPLGGSIRIAYTAAAPYGLGRAQLRYRINEGNWWTLPLAAAASSPQTGPFNRRSGAFEQSGFMDQVEFHAVPSADPQRLLGGVEGGGRFDFQTRRIPNLKVGDRIEFFLEVFDRNPDPDRPPGRSETRAKTVVTVLELENWVRLTLQEESRIRQLENKQRGVFPRPGAAIEN